MAILYKANETDFSHLGLGPLNDAISILVTEERNGIFELEMKYPVSGKLFKELKNDRIIKADAGHKLKDQRFKIIRISKPLDGIVTVYAEHVSYLTQDLALKPKVTFTGNARQALEHWKANLVDDNPFTVWSDITTVGSINWTIDQVENPRRALGGVQGSILDVYGGEYLFDNYDIYLYQKRGVNSELLIAYGRNLVDLEQEEEIANTYTSIYPYSIYTDDDGNERMVTLPEYYIDSEHVDKYARRKILVVDFTNDEIKTVSALRNAARRYIIDNDVGVPRVNLKIQYIDLAKTLDYKDLALYEEVNLCDNVMIYFEKYDINTTAKVIKVVWDVLNERYDSIEVGEARASLSQAIDTVVDGKVHNVEKLAMQTLRTADGKNTIYFGLEEPLATQYPLKKNDIWYRIVDGEFTRTYRYDGAVWQLIIDMDSQQAKIEAQQAKDDAQSAVDRANSATQQATNAINQAQSAFDEAQNALSTASNAYDIATTLQGDVTNLSTLVDEHTGQISSITQSVTGLQTQVSDIDGNVSTLTQTVSNLTTRIGDAEGNITALQQTSTSLAARLTDAEGNITSLTATVSGLQTTVTNVQGDVSSVTQLANALQVRMTDAEGNISTLTQTASSLQSTVSSLQTELDELEISEINLISNSNQRITSTSYLVKEYFINEDFVEGELYTVIIKGDINEGQQFGLWQNRGSHRRGLFDDLGNGLFKLTFESRATTAGNERRFRIYNYPSDGVKSATIEWIKFVRGNKTSLNWTPAPEDMATQSQITQLSDAINLRVQKGDVINQINISDESILIDGKRIHITGQTTIDDASIDGAKIKNASIGNAQIGYIDAAKINSGELNTNNITIFGGNALDYTTIQGSYLELRGRYNRTWQGSTTTHDVRTRLQHGHLRFRNDALDRSLYMSEFGISTYVDGEGEQGGSSGTISWWDTKYSGAGANGLTINSHGGVVALESDLNRIVLNAAQSVNMESRQAPVFIRPYKDNRAGINVYNFSVANGANSTLTDGQLMYGSDVNGYASGLRFSKATNDPRISVLDGNYQSSANTILDTGNVYTNNVRKRDGSGGVYWNNTGTGTTGGTGANFDNTLLASGIRPRYGDSDLFLATDSGGTVRVTDYRGYNNGNGITYRDIAAREFKPQSSERYKRDITPWLDSALEKINQSVIYEYKMKDDDKNLDRFGLIVERETPTELVDDEGILQYSMQAFSWKAIQELDMKFTNLEDEINWLKIENQYLKQKIEQLEEMIA